MGESKLILTLKNNGENIPVEEAENIICIRGEYYHVKTEYLGEFDKEFDINTIEEAVKSFMHYQEMPKRIEISYGSTA
ncbi:MAG: hypothetical protein Q7R52_05210 [archaeon]|nr:hypothetical protein [archaeon]